MGRVGCSQGRKAADHILGNAVSFVPVEEKTTEEVISEVPVLEPALDDSPF